jgi:signal transduction histidine kinase
MVRATIPQNEELRLQDLYETGLLDSPNEVEFEEIVRFASSLCNMPISLISLVDSNRQWFKARVGLDVNETNRDVSFCAHAILNDQLFEIPDATMDQRFHDNPLVVNEPAIRFYAGVPLVTSSGSRLGTLCVIDTIPGRLTDQQKFGLQVLANNVMRVAELRVKNKELYYLTETQKRIISILAHDVRNPLASIKSIIDLNQSELLDQNEAAEMMEMVSSQLNNTIDMVENVVNWGQLQLQFGRLKLEYFDLFELINLVFGSELILSAAKQNKLINSVEPGTVFHSDKRSLEFILRNLVSNANKFTQNGSIIISLQQTGTSSVLKVEDTGVGMTASQIVALWGDENFSQSTLGTSNEKGSGLGLLLVKEFVERLDGHIAVESEVGKGTSFKLIFNLYTIQEIN